MTLLELNRQVAEVVSESFPMAVWVEAEIAELHLNSNGHCYLDFIEKQPGHSAIVARARGMIWANRWWQVSQTFEMGTQQPLRAGLKVLVEVQVQFHENYGYSLVVLNIDPTFTLGEMERKRREIIEQLTADGVVDANRSLPMPPLPQRVAIISANTAAGYGDFCHQLEHNEWGVRFYTHLFPAIMQGQQTEQSVIAALDQIYQHQQLFDVVVIIRGGGAVADLNSFDSYELATYVANFPLPVITGIGHERDKTVLDVVAHTSVKTPTAAAALLIDMAGIQMGQLLQWEQQIQEAARNRIEREQLRIERFTTAIRNTHIRLQQQMGQLDLQLERITLLGKQRISSERQRLTYLERTIQMAQPDNLLQRGFSIVRHNGKAIRSAQEVPDNAPIEIQTAQGSFKATKQL